MQKRIVSVFVLALTSFTVMAEKYVGSGNPGKTDEIKQIAANCIPPSSARELNINNVTALIQSGGDMWWDLQQSPKYEVPKGSGKTALFAGALWLGGVDVSNQLKVAGQRFRTNGNIDYWTGPLRTDGTAEIDPATCVEYDRHFESTRQEVATFVDWFQSGEFDAINGTNTQQEKYPGGYTIPKFILEWPWQEYDEYLAPFFDYNGDGIYNPLDGDYPGYDLTGTTDCRTDRLINIFGDQNLWWVFNDKGNIHTESGAEAIGMEIRAQAFAFATNDEVNDMTFYNYELLNRSTFTLTETYMGQWVDADLGNPQDDYVGCDVMRGLGYCYNGDEVDEDNSGAIGYGDNPPAIGVDFFQGPYQDNDGIDNEIGIGTDEALNGVGYGDGIPDNERFGMRRFLYHNNDGSVRGDPTNGSEYYNYLRGIWRDGSKMVYGGTGHPAGCPGTGPGSGGFTCVEADFMFPDDTDPQNWGTGGTPTGSWNEINSGNTPFDRRFIQSAGPFTLAPGATNNITVGVVWSQATSGGAFGSVQKLRQADDKTQALFDNCFKLLEGPDAPDLTFQELDQELILYISNCGTSNNADEDFAQADPSLAVPDSVIISSETILVQDTVDSDTSIVYDQNGDSVGLDIDYIVVPSIEVN
ncbi:MAG: T9SS C-terminal target domain-containing protein, partial [Flavobacteriales bacterium]|nr:T9SS C-terminal target domain-containing protein [Flavobacteriales bacterium]